MLHTFVTAKLLPRLPSWATYGQRVVPSLVTTPFLALHIYDPDNAADPMLSQGTPNLFIISREKLAFPGSQYFILNQSKAESHTKTLTVVPPLPFQHPLYLTITPRICGEFPDSETYEEFSKVRKHQLDESSFDRLLKAIEEAGPSIPGIRETGGQDEPEAEWDTWSIDSPREAPWTLVMGRYVPLSFDLFPFDAIPPNFTDSSVLEQIALQRQLYLDYTWRGCKRIINYFETMREAIPRLPASGRIFRYPARPDCQKRVLDPSVESLRPSAAPLQSLPVPHDGEPNTDDDEDDIADDWKDEPPLNIKVAKVVCPVRAKKIKLIALDCNTIVDTDSSLKETLSAIFPPSEHHFSAMELLELYIEHEALLRAENHQDSIPATAIIRKVARYLGVAVSEPSVQILLERTTMSIYKDASSAICSLIKRGYAVIALPGPKYQDILQPISGISFSFCNALAGSPSSIWNRLLEFCRQIHPSVSANQILVVTSNLLDIAEPASRAGFPTAFVKRARSRSANLSIPTFSPTYTVTDFGRLLSVLLDPSSVAPAQDPVVPAGFPPFRIRGCYQTVFILGSGSYSYVWNGNQLHTGAGVAVKFEAIKPDGPSTLPYEAAVYAQLEGVRGIPRVHWSGREGNTYVLVIDKLGPNLENIRRFCRGAMSLKTILMLGQQMLVTIEEVHSRGIIVRDIKPENFAMGFIEEYKCLYLLDMGLSKLYLDPTTGTHMPYREGRGGIGTPRYASHNVHFGLEPSRRDDVEAIGIVLLYLFHGRLPWQGICAPDIPAKLLRIGEMKRGKPFADLLARSPSFFTPFFEHCRSLVFSEKPDYAYLRTLLLQTMAERGWEHDWEYDWWSSGEQGTLLPSEYKIDMRFVQPIRHRHDVLG